MTKKEKPVILVCIDKSKASTIALKYAYLKAKKLGFEIRILSVIKQDHKNLLFGSHTIARENRVETEANVKKVISEIFINDDELPLSKITEGEVSSEIVKEIRSDSNYVSLVLGKSQSSAQSDNSVMSKIADKISRKINVPIQIVPENIEDNIFKIMI